MKKAEKGPKTSLFEVVLKEGKRIKTENLSVVFLKNKNNPLNKYVVVVSKKIDKKATKRNNIKRRIKGCLIKAGVFKSKSPAIVVFYPKNNLKQITFVQLCNEIGNIIKSVNN